MSESKRGGAQLARAVEKAYQAGLDDYHLEPMVLVENGRPVGKISDGDSAVFCCRRGEREIELTELFIKPLSGDSSLIFCHGCFSLGCLAAGALLAFCVFK